MASNSEKLLASDDIEGILAVIDSDIFVKLNDLESEFAATISQIKDTNSERYFLCLNRRKTYKTWKGLNRHQSAGQGEYTKTYEERLPLVTYEQFVTMSKGKLVNNQWFQSFLGEFLAFFINKECIQ